MGQREYVIIQIYHFSYKSRGLKRGLIDPFIFFKGILQDQATTSFLQNKKKKKQPTPSLEVGDMDTS
jgi:hypothetical protein